LLRVAQGRYQQIRTFKVAKRLKPNFDSLVKQKYFACDFNTLCDVWKFQIEFCLNFRPKKRTKIRVSHSSCKKIQSEVVCQKKLNFVSLFRFLDSEKKSIIRKKFMMKFFWGLKFWIEFFFGIKIYFLTAFLFYIFFLSSLFI